MSIPKAFSEALKDQAFHNIRFRVLEFLQSVDNLKGATIIIHFDKKKSFLSDNYEVILEAICQKTDGKVLCFDPFFKVSLSSASLLPKYIVEGIKEAGVMDIRIDENDIKVLNTEKDEQIDEQVSFHDIIDTCYDNDIKFLKMADRVFYTRVDFYDGSRDIVDSKFFAKIRNLPSKVYTQLYPFKEYETIL